MTKFIINLKNKLTTDNIIIFSLILILSLILLYSLILTPAIGKADNGDFARMYNSIGLSDMGTNYEEQYDYYFHQIFKINNNVLSSIWCDNWVIGCLVGKLAVIINSLFTFYGNNLFDIRFLGGIYAIIFTIGTYLILKYSKLHNSTKLICGILIILFFTDGIYISYFNSFFGEAATISFLCLTIGSFLLLISKKEPNKIHFIFFYLICACFLTSKTQQLPLLFFVLLISIALYTFYKKHRKLIILSNILLITLCITTFFSISDYTNKNNIYQSVFTGILYNSNNPEKDLEYLGLNPKFACNAGYGFYAEDLKYDPLGDEMIDEFYPNISISNILKFYITHPIRLWENIKSAVDNAYTFYPINYQNYVRGSDIDNKYINTFRYNLIENHLTLHRNIYLYIGFSLLYLITLIFYFIKTNKKQIKLLCLLLLFLLAAGTSQLILPVLGSGFSDIGKHLFLLNLVYDILLCTVIIWAYELAHTLIHYIGRKRIITYFRNVTLNLILSFVYFC